VLSCLLEPFIPSFSAKLNFFLGNKKRTKYDDRLLEFLGKDKSYEVILKVLKPG